MNTAMAKIPAYQAAIEDAKTQFAEMAGAGLKYSDEEIFALQMLTKTDFAMKCASDNPRSVYYAMLNLASTGLTLNPAMGLAYLVPRGREILLNISYKGLIRIATDSGAIEWVRADVVHELDDFEYLGPARMPSIRCNPFKPRGEIVGAYCIAKTASGDILTEVMDLDALHKVRSKSPAYTNAAPGKRGPWEEFFGEMCRKAVVNRGRKTWPYSGGLSDRMALAVDIASKADGGYTFSSDEVVLTVEQQEKSDKDAATVVDFESAIAGAIDETELKKIGSEVAGAGLPTKLQTMLRERYTIKLSGLRDADGRGK